MSINKPTIPLSLFILQTLIQFKQHTWKKHLKYQDRHKKNYNLFYIATVYNCYMIFFVCYATSAEVDWFFDTCLLDLNSLDDAWKKWNSIKLNVKKNYNYEMLVPDFTKAVVVMVYIVAWSCWKKRKVLLKYSTVL